MEYLPCKKARVVESRLETVREEEEPPDNVVDESTDS